MNIAAVFTVSKTLKILAINQDGTPAVSIYHDTFSDISLDYLSFKTISVAQRIYAVVLNITTKDKTTFVRYVRIVDSKAQVFNSIPDNLSRSKLTIEVIRNASNLAGNDEMNEVVAMAFVQSGIRPSIRV